MKLNEPFGLTQRQRDAIEAEVSEQRFAFEDWCRRRGYEPYEEMWHAWMASREEPVLVLRRLSELPRATPHLKAARTEKRTVHIPRDLLDRMDDALGLHRWRRR